MQDAVKRQNSRHTSAKLLHMVQLLLQRGANPNDPHAYPVKDRTPLMLAAENNSVPSLDLMLKHGGDPCIKDADGNDCMKIAISFSSHAVVHYLRTNGVR